MRLSDLRATGPKRQGLMDLEWHSLLASHLLDLATSRIALVRLWMESNVARFPSEHNDVQALRRAFEQLSLDLVAGVTLCGMKCKSCGLLCVDSKRHEGDHNCATNHQCLETCETDEKPCGFS